MSEAEAAVIDEFGDDVDYPTFEQILEMDDDETDREFSSSIVFGFFVQADTTFENMAKAIKDKDLHTLSELGHFLKGSSATLGFTHVKNACEKIQHVGKFKDETGEVDEPDAEKCLKKIAQYMADAQEGTKTAEKLMLKFYNMDRRPESD